MPKNPSLNRANASRPNQAPIQTKNSMVTMVMLMGVSGNTAVIKKSPKARSTSVLEVRLKMTIERPKSEPNQRP